MSAGASFIMDANNRSRNNFALLARRNAFQIKEANKFITPSGRKYTYKKITDAGLKKLRGQLKIENSTEQKRVVMRVGITMVVSFIVLSGITSLLNYIM
jgi:hypothetical protein